MLKFFLHIFLFIVAWLLLPLLTIAMWVYNVFVSKSLYNDTFKVTAINIDIFGSKDFAPLLNFLFLTKKSKHLFGTDDFTISKVLGLNILDETLSVGGKIIVFLLTKKHCLNSI